MPKSYIAPRHLRYEKEWEIDPTYAGWIAPIKNSKEGAQCKYCGVILVADVTSLDSHATSDLHMSNMPNSNYSYYYPGAKYKKVFQGYWMRNPAFKDWLEAVKGATNKARCKYCKTYISARHSSLLKHASTVKHKNYYKKNKYKNSKDHIYLKTENENNDEINYDDNNYEDNNHIIDETSEFTNNPNGAYNSISNMEESFVLVPANEEEIEKDLQDNDATSNSYDMTNSNMLDLECEEVDEKVLSIDKKNRRNGVIIKKTRFSGQVGYNSEWESNIQFKDWISSVKDDKTRAQCIVCLQRMSANYDQLISHSNSQRHRLNMKETGQMDEFSDQEDVKSSKKIYKILGYNRETFYRDEWEENPLFKDWIARVRNSLEKARCRYCAKVMLATSQQLMSHLKSDRHKRNQVILWKKEPEEIKNEQISPAREINSTMSEIQKEWENDPLFRDWIKFIDDDNSKVECKICLRRMYATRFQLLNHIGSRLHQKNTAENVQKHLIYDEEDENFTECIIDPLIQKEEDDIYNDPSDPFVNNNIRVRVLYRHEWQDDKHLKDWISAVPETDKKAFCKVCNMQIRACYPALRIHGRAPHHLTKMMKLGLNPPATKSVLDPINGVFYNVPESTEDVEQDEDMKVEIDSKMSKSYRLGYQFAWEKDANFRDWIIRIKKNDYKVGCRYCRSQMRATMTQLITHMASDRHILMKMLADEEADLEERKERKDETDLEEDDQEYLEDCDSNGKLRKYRRRYLKSWEKDYVMKDWIEPVPGYPYKAMCKFCGVLIAAKRTSLTAHAQSTKHIKKMRTKNEHIGPVKGFDNEKKFIHAPCMDTQQKVWAKYCRTYCKSWELNPLFKSWIEPVPGDITRARCKFCHVLLRARLIELKSHLKTWKHAASIANTKNEASNLTSDVTENCEPNLNVVIAPSRTSVAAQKPKRKISSAGCSLTSTKLVKNVALDLHRTDDSLAPVKCLEKMMSVFPAFNPNSNARTLFVGSGNSFDSSAIDSMMEADPSTIFTIKQGVDPNKRRKRKHDEMTRMVNEVLTTMTRTITPWEFLLYKISRTTKKSSYKIKNLMSEFELLCQQIKEFTEKLLSPVGDVQIETTNESFIKVNDSLACKCIGLSKNNYRISNESEKLFSPNLTIPIRFTHQVIQGLSNQIKEQEETEDDPQLQQQQQQCQIQTENVIGIENVVPGNLMMLEDGRICQIVDINSINPAATYEVF